jgi:hypothetical protein
MLDDSVIAPSLELVRRVCNPRSNSTPHITVRYPVDKLIGARHMYENARIDYVDLLEPGAFGLAQPGVGSEVAGNRRTKRTVYIRCDSPQLDSLAYKPHYPDSVFHVTVYEGVSDAFARALHAVLRQYDWGRRLVFRRGTSLTEIPIGRQRRSKPAAESLSPDALRLLNQLAPDITTPQMLAELEDFRRLALVDLICVHLHSETSPYREALKDGSHGWLTTQAAKVASDPGVSPTERTSSADHETAERFRQAGVFLTPPELAIEMARCAVAEFGDTSGPIHFGDPAFGTGAFFRALTSFLPKDSFGSAIGIEIDSDRAETGRRRWAKEGLTILPGDYLHMGSLPQRNLILANPPYVRHQRLPSAYKQLLRKHASSRTAIPISGLSGLYVYFMLLSHEWMLPGAVAAWLIPSEFMDTRYGEAVRRYLTEHVELRRVHLFDPDDEQFENARVSSAIVVFRNRLPRPGNVVTFTQGGTLANPLRTHGEIGMQLGTNDGWRAKVAPRARRKPSTIRLGDLFEIKRGLATGANRFFILPRELAASKGLPAFALRPILPKARTLESDVIESDPDGYPAIAKQYCLLDCSLSREEIARSYPALDQYLASADLIAVRTRRLVADRTLWYRQEVRPPAPFLCTYMGRGAQGQPPIRFLWNKSEATATNTYLLLYPREGLTSWGVTRPDTEARLFSTLRALAEETLRDVGRIYAGGLHKVEPRELSATLLPMEAEWLEEAVPEHLALRDLTRG